MFKVGDWVQVNDSPHNTSRDARVLRGKFGTIIRINTGFGNPWVILDIEPAPWASGIWFHEITLVSFTDKDFEYV